MPQVIYTPTSGYSGTDSFQYRVCDSAGTPACSTSTISIEITANNANVTTPAGGPATSGSYTLVNVGGTTTMPESEDGDVTESSDGTNTLQVGPIYVMP